MCSSYSDSVSAMQSDAVGITNTHQLIPYDRAQIRILKERRKSPRSFCRLPISQSKKDAPPPKEVDAKSDSLPVVSTDAALSYLNGDCSIMDYQSGCSFDWFFQSVEDLPKVHGAKNTELHAQVQVRKLNR